VRGKDYEYDGPPLVLDGVKYSLTGVAAEGLIRIALLQSEFGPGDFFVAIP
jgi:hypothetical protein